MKEERKRAKKEAKRLKKEMRRLKKEEISDYDPSKIKKKTIDDVDWRLQKKSDSPGLVKVGSQIFFIKKSYVIIWKNFFCFCFY